jgi:signal transduction histidine kinase
MQSITVDDLKHVVALSDLVDEHLQWIIDHSEYREYADGELIGQYGEPADTMFIILVGKVVFYMYIKGRQVYYFTFENNNVTGGIGGLMPYSRMKTHPGYSYALGEVKMLRMNKKHFAELERLNPDFMQKLIGYMTERARVFATTQLQYEKVNALGNLAAGIAHELNNPAAAIRAISDELAKRLDANYELTRKMLQCKLTPENLRAIQVLVEKKENEQAAKTKQTTLQRMENEDRIEGWLEENGITTRQTAETFSEIGFLPDELETICADSGKEAFVQAIPWLENLISSRRIIRDLANASNRISNLVGSIKSHVHMDRSNDLQPTNIHEDIENTLTLLGFKLREKNIEVRKKFYANMPDIPAYVGELNQVWTNLIDNAIFALDKQGTLDIVTSRNDNNVMVSIIDNGQGIPKEVMPRIFDPFFTTKKVGEGTGIGLDIVNRIVKHHNGEIKVTSEPARTEFSVCLPLAQKAFSL